jgi:hypothetical protein
MRISENRYRRDQRSIRIAMCFLELEARTQTIRTWTGLSGDRVRKLYREYMATASRFVTRRRGKSPQQVAYFWNTARIRQEATWLASLLTLLGVITRDQIANQGQQSFPDLERAELLCRAYGIYQSMIPSSQISFEHAVFLARILWNGNQIRLGTCPDCGGLVIVDPLSTHDKRCNQCATTD